MLKVGTVIPTDINVNGTGVGLVIANAEVVWADHEHIDKSLIVGGDFHYNTTPGDLTSWEAQSTNKQVSIKYRGYPDVTKTLATSDEARDLTILESGGQTYVRGSLVTGVIYKVGRLE